MAVYTVYIYIYSACLFGFMGKSEPFLCDSATPRRCEREGSNGCICYNEIAVAESIVNCPFIISR